MQGIKIDLCLFDRSKKIFFLNYHLEKSFNLVKYHTLNYLQKKKKIYKHNEVKVCRAASREYHQLGYQESSGNRQKFL